MADGDAVHPGAAGNIRRAQGLAAALGIPVSLPDPGATAPGGGGGGGASYTYRGDLTAKRGTWAAASETQVAYRLGLVGNYPTVVFRFVVNTRKTSTYGGVRREFYVTVLNNNAAAGVNKSTGIGGSVTSVLVHSADPGSGVVDVTMSTAVVSEQLEIRLTSVSAGGSFDITGSYIGTAVPGTGQLVYENAV
jgi:hypothetical protein